MFLSFSKIQENPIFHAMAYKNVYSLVILIFVNVQTQRHKNLTENSRLKLNFGLKKTFWNELNEFF